MIRFALACALALVAPVVVAQDVAAPNDAAAPSPFDIQYTDVATARTQVTGLSNARSQEFDNGKLIVITNKDGTQLEYWEFVATTDPAYPAVLRRRMRMESTGLTLQRSTLCQASADACSEWEKRLAIEEAALKQELSGDKPESAKERRRQQLYKEAARNNYGR